MNLLIMIPIYLFILIGALRLCYVRTLHETKLASIFIQETQGYYLVENLMALARDYAYQIVQNPREPHLFLSASAYRTKDKTGLENDEDHKDKWVIDFNGSLGKQQIVPDDFSLKIADNGWDIKGGPIFWKDNKKNNNDERYLAEVFMLGSLKFVSNLVPNWTIRTVQTMEIERNPLCDFQLYAEGDTTINTNINKYIDTAGTKWYSQIDGPVQINGNARFSPTNGENDNYIQFLNKFNTSGYALKLLGGENSINDYVLPQKYHMLDNHENHQVASGSGTDSYQFNRNAIDYTGDKNLEALNSYNNNNIDTTYDSYERYMFNLYRGNFNTCSRIYRPIGFDPSNYWGFWDPSKLSYVNDTYVNPQEQVLNYCFGFHNLAQSSALTSYELYSLAKNESYSPLYAIDKLRGLKEYQATEKARLVEMQKPINFPAVMLRVIIHRDPDNKNKDSFRVPNNFIFSTYINNAFPAIKDNIYLNRYFNLAFQNNTVIEFIDVKLSTTDDTEYSFDYAEAPTNCITKKNLYTNICSNKSAFHKVNAEQFVDMRNITPFAELRSTFSPTSSGDDNCPPNKLIDAGSFWTLDNYITRITGDHYNFLYDRNRAKWIQLVDIDVGKLSRFIDGASMPNTLIINTWWQSKDACLANKNYLYKGKDIRYNYSANREDFFNNYRDGSYVYPNDETHPPVIDIGVRLINATTLPQKGLTIYCPYPLYIKGDFNTTEAITTSGTCTMAVYGSDGKITASGTANVSVDGAGHVSGIANVKVVAKTATLEISLGRVKINVQGTMDKQGNVSVSGSGSLTIEITKQQIPITVSGTGTANITKFHPPALIVTDSITVLPDGWQDWRSQTDPINSHLWYGKKQTQTSEIGYGEHRRIEGTTIYADIITGRTHPHFWIKNADTTNFSTQNQRPNPDMGIHDAFRSLSDLNSSIKLHGSLMLPYYCQEQWEPPIDFCKTITNRNPNIYAYPNIDFSPRTNAGIPAGMPFYYRINRGRKTHYIGKKAYEVLSGENLYNKDWASCSFSNYHVALPNYLKYEVAP